MDESNNKNPDSLYVGKLQVAIVANEDDQRLSFYFEMPPNSENMDRFEFLAHLKTLNMLNELFNNMNEFYENRHHIVEIQSLTGEEFSLSILGKN